MYLCNMCAVNITDCPATVHAYVPISISYFFQYMHAHNDVVIYLRIYCYTLFRGSTKLNCLTIAYPH